MYLCVSVTSSALCRSGRKQNTYWENVYLLRKVIVRSSPSNLNLAFLRDAFVNLCRDSSKRENMKMNVPSRLYLAGHMIEDLVMLDFSVLFHAHFSHKGR